MRERERDVTVSASLHCLGESVGVVDRNSFEVGAWKRDKRKIRKQ